MTPDERQLLAGLFDRVRAAAGNARDRDAEAFINDAVRALPYAPYLLTQTVIVQEEGLKAAAAKIDELEAKVRDLEAQANSGAGSFLGGIGKSIFGADQRPAPPRSAVPPSGPWGAQAAQAPTQPSSGPWAQPQSTGGSFLKGALGTAAGVAGGMLLANSLSGLFSGHHNSLGIGSGLDTSGIFPSGSPLDSHRDSATGVSNAAYGSSSSDQDQDQDQDDDDDDDQAGDFGSDDGMTEA